MRIIKCLAGIAMLLAFPVASAQTRDVATELAKSRYVRVCSPVDPDIGCACKAENVETLAPNEMQLAPFFFAINAMSTAESRTAVVTVLRDRMKQLGFPNDDETMQRLAYRSSVVLDYSCDTLEGEERGTPLTIDDVRKWTVTPIKGY